MQINDNNLFHLKQEEMQFQIVDLKNCIEEEYESIFIRIYLYIWLL